MLTSEWRDLYQQVVLDHYRHPRNYRRLEPPAHQGEGYNPFCGDRVTVFVLVEGGALTDVSFEGSGCALCVASASLMTEALRGKTRTEADVVLSAFRNLVTTSGEAAETDDLGDLLLLAGVREFPTRVKCVTLAWHAAQAALKHHGRDVSI